MKSKILVSVVLLLASSMSFGQSDEAVRSLTVDEAVELAKKNNVSVARSQITLDAAARAKSHSWNSISPTASLSASSTVPIDALSDVDSNYTASFGLSATVSLSLSANLYTSMNAAKIAYESGKLTFDDAVKSVELGVREAFYGLLYERENIVLQERNLEIAKTQYNNNLAKYNQGRLSEIDVLSAEVNYKSKIPTLESARTTFLNDMASFKQTLGLKLNEKIELAGTLDDLINLNEISVDLKSVQSSSIKQLEYKIENAKNSVLSKRFSAYAPNLNASFNWSDEKWYVGYDGTPEDPKKSASVRLSASIPLDGILPWSERNDAIDTAEDTVKDLELQLDNEKKNLARTVMSSLRSIKQSQESIKYKQANVTLAQKTYDMTAEAYNRGTKDLLTLQNANTSLLNAQVSLKSETLTLIKAILNLENTIGVEFGTLGK
ncbi:TolC family protein [Treponema ruminis]|uniref:Outer membrane protein TolC n=1 Tax=Treponema ruminis TaxID=744515 RepID=A0A7W8G6J7_9SPIR|nr:TolC family protein [Treponema ruminis]MBB5224773.1 outer membrane protein TolC [Treponema ruminis]